MSTEEQREAIHDLGSLAGHTTRESINGGLVGAGMAGVGHWVMSVTRGNKSAGVTAIGTILGLGTAVGASIGAIKAISEEGYSRREYAALNGEDTEREKTSTTPRTRG